MESIEVSKTLKNDAEVVIKVKNEMIRGKINIDANLGVGYFFNDDINKMNFLPVYDSLQQGVEGRTVILNKRNIEWLSANIDSDPNRDCVLGGGYNPIRVTITLRDTIFVGEINLGYHKRLSDRLNDTDNHFIPLLNAEFQGRNRTIFINVDAILSVYDDIESRNDNDLVADPYENERFSRVTNGESQRVITVDGSIDNRARETGFTPTNRSTRIVPQKKREIGKNDFSFKRG